MHARVAALAFIWIASPPADDSSLAKAFDDRSIEEARPAMPKAESVLDPETICGIENDLQHVEAFVPPATGQPSRDYVRKYSKATVQLQWLPPKKIRQMLRKRDKALDRTSDHIELGNVGGRRWCTGTLISENRVLTAKHCIDWIPGEWKGPVRTVSGNSLPVGADELVTLLKVNFNYQLIADTQITRTVDTFPVKKLVEAGSSLDYAILEIGRNDDGLSVGELRDAADPTLDRYPQPKFRLHQQRVGGGS